MSLRSLTIEENPLLCSFLKVPDWNNVTLFLIPLAVNFLFLNLGTGALLPKTARWRSASMLFVGKQARSSGGRRCSCVALGVSSAPTPKPYSLPACQSKTAAASSHIFLSNCCKTSVVGWVT